MPPYPTPPESSTPTCSSDSESENTKRPRHDLEGQPSSKRQRIQIEVKSGTLCFPRSYYAGWKSPIPPVSESSAITDLGAIWNAQDHSGEEFNIWKLDDFTVYRTSKDYRHANELCALHNLKTKTGVNDLFFDGILDIGSERRYIQRVPFECLTIEGYGDDDDLVSACIQTAAGQKANVWYELGRPASEYARYYDCFAWISRFGKYVIEFLEDSPGPVTLSAFRRALWPYLTQRYPLSRHLQDWMLLHGTTDFGQAFCANVSYLIKEAWSVNHRLLDHVIFSEVNPQCLEAIPMEDTKFTKTVVTPFVFEMFERMPFSSQLQVVQLDATTAEKQNSRRAQLGLTPTNCRPTSVPFVRHRSLKIRQGDVVSIAANDRQGWRTSEGSSWYAYVQGIRTTKKGKRLDLIWLYEPSDTTLGEGVYPYKNELFHSDNCACGHEAVDSEVVESIVPVKWFVGPEAAAGSFFVRQKFHTEATAGTYDFVKLQPTDLRCNCQNTYSEMDGILSEFRKGDTVLVRQHDAHGNEILEPVIIREFLLETITVQSMIRCRRDLHEKDAPPNKITPGTNLYAINPDAVVRRCRVACFKTSDDIEMLYDLDGAADHWYVISPLAPTWNIGHQAFAPDTKLDAMGIFCGGGSFDRGLEEGGGVNFKWAVDWATHALHTYRANLDEPEKLHLFLGSVNDYLAKAMQDSESEDKRIATVGEVDFLAAGSPCPGFSLLQRDRTSEQSLKNCSLVSSVCAYVDLYMPKYLILENVVGMARNPNNAELNVFSQVLCCLVAMGYQIQQFLMDPGNYGSCQSRQRIFIIATAPSNEPPTTPPQTHACAELEKYSRAIGILTNGLPFGKRRYDVCPFESLTAKEAFQGLPGISDGHVQTCISYPDHRLCRHESSRTRELIQMIPRFPYGQGFMQAVQAGTVSRSQIQRYRWENKNRAAAGSKSWSRVRPDRLVGCLTTMIKPHDSFLGQTLHYDESRLMSVMEARRVQAIPDHEIVIGIPTQQWKILGNGVDRKVAFALGVQFAYALGKTLKTKTQASLSTATSLTDRQDSDRIETILVPQPQTDDLVFCDSRPIKQAACSANRLSQDLTCPALDDRFVATPSTSNRAGYSDVEDTVRPSYEFIEISD